MLIMDDSSNQTLFFARVNVDRKRAEYCYDSLFFFKKRAIFLKTKVRAEVHEKSRDFEMVSDWWWSQAGRKAAD